LWRFSSVAPSLGVELTAVNAQDAGEIERAVTEFARAPNSGLIVTGGAPIVSHRERMRSDGPLSAELRAVLAVMPIASERAGPS
jgi:hypothetical protein